MTTRVGQGDYQYEVVSDWAKLPEGWTWGWIPAVGVDSQDRVIVSSRSEHTLIIFDNGIYEITGAQPTPATAGGDNLVDYPALAAAAGFRQIFAFDQLDHWQQSARDVIDAPGPTFVHLAIEPVPGAAGPRSPSHAPTRADQFAEALQG